MLRSSAMTMAARAAMRLLGASSRPSILCQCQTPLDDLRRHLFSDPAAPPRLLHRITQEIHTGNFARRRVYAEDKDEDDYDGMIDASDSSDEDFEYKGDLNDDDDDDDIEDFDFDDDEEEDEEVKKKKTRK